jgi:apolipoprotein N-acyltransferase
MGSQPSLPFAKSGPESAVKMKSFAVGSAVVATSAMLFWGTGLHPIWWLTWFAPLPVLLVSPRLGGWRAFWVTALSWFLGSLNMWHYMLTNFVSLPLVLIFSIMPACLFGVAVLLFRRFVLRGALGKAALVFPTFWVTLEYRSAGNSAHAARAAVRRLGDRNLQGYGFHPSKP